MSGPHAGGCLCGAVRYAFAGDPAPAGICHCEDCRRTTGAAFNISVGVASAEFEVLQGQPSAYAMTAESGTLIVRHFCPDCGSPLWTSSPAHPERVFVKAGSLDDPSLVVPALEAWTGSAVAWSRIPDGLPRFPGNSDG